MWSHYADKHKGICLGFKEIGFRQNDGIDAVKVKYADSVAPMLFTIPSRSNNNTIAMINLFCTKAKVWAYEQEVRIMAYNNPGLHPISPGYLCEVYFGVNSSENDIQEIGQLLLKHDYKDRLYYIGKMMLSEMKFELDIQPISF